MSRMTNRVFLLTLTVLLLGLPAVGDTQSTSPSLNGTQSVVPLSQQPTAFDTTTTAGAAGGVTPAQVAPGVNTAVSSSIGKSFGTVGRGLPGFPGGPPLNGTPGVGDTSTSSMRPKTIPPLLCDPAVDIPC
ncbi:conserved exported protein of unknown function [Nitrospira japonica]|uniref:Uncharacterized protein n=1 Tax=Nitrospira japonica TaxID=1325564 RepID=A0A1W1I1A8_9BACT|nr:hypothetical protein [Nitrospira japonica]SLM46623.1 conserved exported protein of unknown function [Nitrospira japonica]